MKSRLLNVLCILFYMLFTQNIFAQSSRQITGRVISSDDKLGLPGVSVVVKGTTTATQTDAKGDYTITVPSANSILVFTSIGFNTQEMAASQGVVNISLEPQTTDLNEVVVIGYGEVARKDLTGSVASVKMADLEKAPVRSFEEALADRVAQ